jgi:transposase
MDVVGAKEIAERLGVPANTVHVWRKRGVLPEPDGFVSGMPAWKWATIRNRLRSSGNLPKLRHPILNVVATPGSWTTSAVTAELARRGVVDARAIRSVWTVLNDLHQEGLLGIALGNRWFVAKPIPTAADDTRPLNQPIVGGNGQPAPLASGPLVPEDPGS